MFPSVAAAAALKSHQVKGGMLSETVIMMVSSCESFRNL